MTNGQRLILAFCAVALGGYLFFLATRVTVGSAGAAGAAIEAAGTAPQIADAAGSLAAIGMTLEPYRHGVIKPNAGTIRVDRNGDDGFGVSLLPAGITHNRVIRFEAEGNERVIVRSTISGERHYRNAAPGDFLRITPETEEVLIFTEDSDYIDIRIFSLTDCDTDWDSFCADENYLAEEIGVPRAAEPTKENLLKILDWTANNIVWSGDRAITAEANVLVKKYTAAQMYATVFETETSGGFCGAAGVFLSKVLNDFGYQAMTINFGTGLDLTHVSTLVYNPFGDEKFYMVDPTFNAIFVNERSGEWIPFDDLLAGKTEGALVLERPVEGRRFLTNRPIAVLENCRPAKGRDDADICFRPGYNFEFYMASFGDTFAKYGFTPDQDGYMLMLRSTYFNIGDQAGSDVRDRFIALLEQNNIAYEKK